MLDSQTDNDCFQLPSSRNEEGLLFQFVAQWWDHYTAWPKRIDGNTLEKAWKPRQSNPTTAIVAFGGMVTTIWIASWLKGVPAISSTVKACLLLYILAYSGFAYTNHCTTARRSLFRGKHGDHRDIKLVNVLLPFILVVGMGAGGWGWSVPSLLFEGRSDYTSAAAEVDWALFRRLGSFFPSADVCPSVVYTTLLVGGFWAGLHMPYLTRPGSILARSVSQRDMATAGPQGYLGYAVKAIAALSVTLEHLLWAARAGELLPRVAGYAVLVGFIVLVSRTVRTSYYWHLHHWAVGLLLVVMAHGNSPAYTLCVGGFALSQFIEGASRWSCAPLWHKLDV